VAAAIPVLVHVVDGLGDVLAAADAPGDLGPSRAPDLKQLARALRPRRGQRRQPAKAAHGRPATLGPLQGIAQLFAELAPVTLPHGSLHAVLRSPEELVHAQRVAGTPGVLEQRRVRQVGLGPGVESDHPAERLRDAARSFGMATWMPLGEVQRVRQAGEDGRETDGRAWCHAGGHLLEFGRDWPGRERPGGMARPSQGDWS
jgi:hypothetical protein